jgi:glutathione S-transferase
MKIYGNFMSPPANMVRLAASAAGVPHDYQHVDLQKGEQRNPDFRAVNPYGKVPALVDGDLKLAESCAISRYIAAKAKSDLYPDDIRQRAIIDQWMDFAAHHIRSNMGKVLFNRVFAPMVGAPVDEKSIKDGLDALGTNLPHVEAQLGKSRYLAQGRLTLADIAMIAALEPFEMINYSLDPFPNVKRWRDGIMAEAWYKNVHARYGAEMQR